MNTTLTTRDRTTSRLLLLILPFIVCALLAEPALADIASPAGATVSALDAGKALLQQGKYDDALTAFGEAKANEASAAEAQQMIVVCYQRKGDFDKAIDACRKLTSQYPTSEAAKHAHYLLGACYVGKGLHPQAVTELTEQLKMYPGIETPETLQKLVQSYRTAGSTALADDTYKQLFRLTLSEDKGEAKRANMMVGYQLRLEGKWADAASHYAAIKDSYPEDAERICLNLADSQFSSEQYDSAISSYREFVKLFPKNARANHARLRIEEAMRDLGDLDKALAYLEELAAEGGDTRADALLRQAEILGHYNKQSKAALDICKKIEEEFSADTRIMGLVEFNRGCIYLSKLAEPAEARKHFEKMLKDYPDKNLDVEAACHIAASYYAEGDLAKAQTLYEKAAKDYESPVKCWRGHACYMAGECLFRQGKTAEAIEAWKQVMINYGECDFGKLADIMIAEIQGR